MPCETGRVDEMRRFRRAAGAWAARGGDDGPAAEAARELAVVAGVRKVVLVEGESDLAAVEALARRRGRCLDEEGVAVLPLGGAMSIGRFLAVCGPDGLDVTVAGLCDAGRSTTSAAFSSGPARAPTSPMPTWSSSVSTCVSRTWRTS